MDQSGRCVPTLSQSTEPDPVMSSETMPLSTENVEKVLDELRPFLMADGGNVEVVEIDGPVVKVRLQGACGSCPSSTMTLKMGIERKMRECIPEVSEVIQVL
tara:strand:- start:39 stop:344 length:306 start_codon:yes stop_codon:yes gene_type:complete